MKPIKQVLITGACGFIGSHFVEAILKTTDWNIVGLDRIDETSTLERIRDTDAYKAHRSRFRFVWHDLRSPINPGVSRQIRPVNLILHLAAGTHVDRSITWPGEFVADNVVGMAHLLDWQREHLVAWGSMPMLFNFSTDEVFGVAPPGVAYKEYDPFHPGNPYSATKAAAVDLCESYANTYGLPIVTTFCMNVIGERQHPEKFLPLLVRKILLGESVTIHADPSKTQPARRSYIHARNVWNVVRFLIDSTSVVDSFRQRFNIAGHAELDCVEFGDMVAQILGRPWSYELVDFHSSRPGHDLRYALDGGKLDRAGFTQPVSFAESLEHTVRWFAAHPEWLGMDDQKAA